MKFLKTIRFDPSDTHVFERAAGPDEWAIPGGFTFGAVEPASLTGKRKQAFSNGFLSLTSLGFSTFCSVALITQEQRDRLIASLAQHFVDHHGAPSFEAAHAAARNEIAFTVDLCRDVPINSVFTLRRFLNEDGEIREEFRIVDPPGEALHARVWEIVEER